AIVGNTTWEVMNAKKALKIEWEEDPEKKVVVSGFGGQKRDVTIPAGLESTDVHKAKLQELSKKPGMVLRRDGDLEAAFKNPAKFIERTYTAPYLAHNTMEPVNCFADVTADKAEI